jgi:hypothetical protein
MLSGDLMIATQDKNDKLELVKEAIRNMALRVEMKWGVSSGQYRRLGISGMNNMPDDTLLFTARRVHTVMTGYLTDLASAGLTQDMLDDFEDLNEAFEVAKNDQQDKTNTRDMSTLERINYANELYNLVAHYCDIGKRVFVNSNIAKYNDYLIYGAAPVVLPGKIQGLNYNPMLSKFLWLADSAATSYEVQKSTDGAIWTQIYAGASAETVIEPVPGAAQVRCRGINDNGSGAWSDVLDYMIQLGTPHINSCVFDSGNNRIALSWDVVDYASSYLIYQSEVPTGQPAGEYLPLDEPTGTTYYFDSPTSNTKQYFYIVAEYAAGGMESSPSNVVSVEIPVV